MNQQLFENLCTEFSNYERIRSGIGTLSEKTIHALLKDYMDSNPLHQEQPFHGYIADIYDGSAIVEIQTRSFDRLRNKLDVFLKEVPVTIVHPIPHTKWLLWIDEETGEVFSKRKSPKIGNPNCAMPELYRIKTFLKNPNLHLHFIFLDIEEYRLLNGWSSDKKKGYTRQERLPLHCSYELTIDTIEDYKKFLPPDLPSPFTSKDYHKAAKVSLSCAQTSLNILTYMDVVMRIGKNGNAILYEKSW
ncbi:MAG: hypothetical protein PHY47_10825 [Lachnospiraceae bacterium]|nr:hypothetical protein [Lachnospiraceae bacterium]